MLNLGGTTEDIRLSSLYRGRKAFFNFIKGKVNYGNSIKAKDKSRGY